MKRSPIVAVGTVVGLASVLTFHTSHVKLNLGLAADATTTQPVATTTQRKAPATTKAPTTTTLAPRTSTSATVAGPNSTVAPTTSTTTTLAPTTTILAPTTTTATATGVRSATGPLVNYYYGVLSVKVTANGRKITGVTIASINDGGIPLSQQIDQYSVPILGQEALRAQSGSIQSVSGASYTSAGFQLSLQNALKTLGV